MRALRSFALVTMLFAAATACGKKKDSAAVGSDQASASDTTGSGSASAGSAAASGSGSASASDTTGSGSASAGSAVASGSGSASGQPEVNTPPPAGGSAVDTTNMAHKAGNCPSTVAGATTTVADSKDGKGVVLTISSKDKDAVWAIQTRAKHLVDVQNAPDTKVEHTGKGTGGGTAGVCPVVTKDTKVTVEEVADGVKVTIVPAGALTAAALKADVDQRIKKSATLTDEVIKPATATAGSGKGEAGTGGGAGKHGGNRTGKGDGSGPRNGTGGGTGGGKQGSNHM
jgi:hypothetical protein